MYHVNNASLGTYVHTVWCTKIKLYQMIVIILSLTVFPMKYRLTRDSALASHISLLSILYIIIVARFFFSSLFAG